MSTKLPKPEMHVRSVRSEEIELKFIVQMPRAHDFSKRVEAGEKVPVFVSLHGSGGHNYLNGLMEGAEGTVNLEYVDDSFEYPFIVLAPSLPTREDGRYACRGWGAIADLVIKALDLVLDEFPADRDRVYLGGFSMGGRGTWDVAIKYPERFAALVPAAGWRETEGLERIKHLPIWVFHGLKDPVVYYFRAKPLVDRLLELGAEVTLTTFPGGHVLEKEIFSEGTMRWLLKYTVSGSAARAREMEEREAKARALEASRPCGKAYKGTPVIDGEIDPVWDRAEFLETRVNVTGNDSAWARFKLLWDENYLYVLADVTDATPVTSTQEVKDQDSVEMFVDYYRKGKGVYDEGCGQYRVSRENRKSGFGPILLEKFVTAVKPTSKGYLVEAAIPFHEGIKGSEGMTIGFELKVNDDMGNGKKEGVKAWADDGNNAWADPSVFGKIQLVK